MTKKEKEKQPTRDDKAGITEVVSFDIGTEGETPVELDAETTADLLHDAREENYVEEIGRYTHDLAIQESLAERQDLNNGQEQMLDRLEEHHATSPTLSGGDVDAAWEDANVGEETVGGMNPTPDQDMVEEIGEALGITYAEGEPLRTGEKLAERDEHRWELDPESVEEE
ncbi:MAG: hypothetical protein KJ069_30965 [Anaerolineae bacterium]|nr:hypothetical protein [Anaerolineae bacterium]